MDTEMWYDKDKKPYILFTITVSPLIEDIQKAMDCIQFPEKYGIEISERIRILDIDSEPYWEDPRIHIIMDMSSDKKTIEMMISALNRIETIINGK